ncbi:hypothetical protein QJS10_CPB20g00002 [Acorus calamus]|uniref:Uncharacterized protein n=1 Tax=Acorus calamus TaxID=4465 RepID=A0AAV9CDG4_ACOCL|nr:hypothetical protein QJS10_CPB20g00002 [Acorus calamus]
MVATLPERLKLGFIGVGWMTGEHMERPHLPSNIHTTDPSSDHHDAFTSFGVIVLESNSHMINRSIPLFMCLPLSIKKGRTFAYMCVGEREGRHLQLNRSEREPDFRRGRLVTFDGMDSMKHE